MKSKKPAADSSDINKNPKPEEQFLKRGNKGKGSKNMGNDISSEIKIANSHGEREGGDDKSWHINEGK